MKNVARKAQIEELERDLAETQKGCRARTICTEEALNWMRDAREVAMSKPVELRPYIRITVRFGACMPNSYRGSAEETSISFVFDERGKLKMAIPRRSYCGFKSGGGERSKMVVHLDTSSLKGSSEVALLGLLKQAVES